MALYLRWTEDPESDLRYPHSRLFVTLDQITDDEDFDQATLRPGDRVRVREYSEGLLVSQSDRIVFEPWHDGVVAVVQPGLCGIPCASAPDSFAAARANAYHLGREGSRLWSRYLVLYEGQPCGEAYDAVLFQPERIIKQWDASIELGVSYGRRPVTFPPRDAIRLARAVEREYRARRVLKLA